VEHIPATVVGGGQAGLAMSHELAARGVEHVVLERGRIAQTWRDRWDSFCLVTPNWTARLPGFAYDDPAQDGFMPATTSSALSSGTRARSTRRCGRASPSRRSRPRAAADSSSARPRATCEAARSCSHGRLSRSHRPAAAAGFLADVVQLDVQTYRSPGALPPGRVLIVGSGQSGCQIAEELHEAGRDVLLASAACRGRRAGSAAATCSAASRRGRRRRATARRRGRCWLRRS
jgi:putative flavoprotein involved in K+ transport